MSIQKHEAISLFGAPNTKGLVVSQDLSSIGINLLRKAPCDIKMSTVPDIHQPRYAIYKSLLPYFIHSYLKDVRVSTLNPGYVTKVDDIDLLPLPFPYLAINWAFEIAQEVQDRVRTEFKGRDIAAGGRAIMLVPISSKQTLIDIRELNPNSTTPCVQDAININAYRTLFMINNLISSLLLTHTYPAFTDTDHFNKFEMVEFPKDKSKESDDDEEDMPDNVDLAGQGEVAGRKFVEVDGITTSSTTLKVGDNLVIPEYYSNNSWISGNKRSNDCWDSYHRSYENPEWGRKVLRFSPRAGIARRENSSRIYQAISSVWPR